MDLEAALRAKVLTAVLKAVANLARPVAVALEAVQDGDLGAIEVVQARSAVKMYVLLVNWMAVAAEQAALKNPGAGGGAAAATAVGGKSVRAGVLPGRRGSTATPCRPPFSCRKRPQPVAAKAAGSGTITAPSSLPRSPSF